MCMSFQQMVLVPLTESDRCRASCQAQRPGCTDDLFQRIREEIANDARSHRRPSGSYDGAADVSRRLGPTATAINVHLGGNCLWVRNRAGPNLVR